ncbi:hypothetical protein GO988_23655 [Hymenobacter sp. HMF4947]|uniref:Uncharacterized protein n=1 Tax=Hymenobacter ginkgonis TaxID=2682976 RepID=A0A7K1TLP1_9BACT|nr:hypothetical protein [Hymenobacter ginkgonis]MVN79337.1 hypothetical protein [Hymenobacter ginkgonis]
MKTGLPITVLKEAVCIQQATGHLLKGILLTPQPGNVGKLAFNHFLHARNHAY